MIGCMEIRAIGVDVMEDGVVVAFNDGTTVLYSTKLLHSISAQGKTINESNLDPEPND